MQISLEAFQPAKVISQSGKLHELARINRGWMPGTPYEGFARRYGSGRLQAARSLVRVARSGGEVFKPYIIHEQTEAGHGVALNPIGVATIIRNQRIRIPEAGRSIAGTDVDYWLSGLLDNDLEAHGTVAKAVLDEADRFGLANGEAGGGRFAALEPGKPHQPIGFADHLPPIGGPDHIEDATPYIANRPYDPYGVTKDGRVLQVYGTVLAGGEK